MSTTATADRQKRCHYEVLGLSRDCSPEEIRSAYRKLALQLHPDKIAAQSPGGAISPAATAAFQELLHAYETLSDAHARAFYDSHRSQILFSDPAANSSSKRNNNSFFDLDLFAFFSLSAFSGFADVGRGFYKVYGDVFGRVYEKEVFFLKQMGLPLDSVRPPPLFGNLDSDYEQASAFYGYWLGFCTVLDFGWVDKYDAAAGDSRRERRLMEEENKKIRKRARREYNENVRALAAFAKKKDKRVLDYLTKKKEKEERKRMEENERRKEEQRKKMERARMHEEQEWEKVVEEEEECDEEEGDGCFFHCDDATSVSNKKNRKNKGSEAGTGASELYCVVCSKKFKSEKQWKNHEQSKKHKDKVAELRETMIHDDDNDDDEEDEVSSEDDFQEPPTYFGNVPEDVKNDQMLDELAKEFESGLQSHVKDKNISDSEETTDVKAGYDDEVDILEAMVSEQKNRKAVNVDQFSASPSRTFDVDIGEDSFMESFNQKKGRKNKTKRRANKGQNGDVKEVFTSGKKDDGAHFEDNKSQNMEESTSQPAREAEEKAGKNNCSERNQKPKNDQVGGKVAGKKDKDLTSRNSTKGKKSKGASRTSGNECVTCGESFDTRNKLFAHLGATGHATLKSR